MLEVAGQFRLRCSIVATVSRSRLIRETLRNFVATAQLEQHRRRHAPRLARGTVATGQTERSQVSQAIEFRALHPQQLAAPRRIVGAQAHTIQREPEHRILDVMFGANRGDMRMVMLHRDDRQAALCGISMCELGAVKIGVQIVRHDLGLHIEFAAQARHGIVEHLPRFGTVQVTDQLRNICLVSARNADSILEPRSARQDWRPGIRQGNDFIQATFPVSRQQNCGSRSLSTPAIPAFLRRWLPRCGSLAVLD